VSADVGVYWSTQEGNVTVLIML